MLLGTDHEQQVKVSSTVLRSKNSNFQGDSGGPLVCSTEDGKKYIGGVTSFGLGCATRGIPGVYTEVSHYTDWIEARIREDRAGDDLKTDDTMY